MLDLLYLGYRHVGWLNEAIPLPQDTTKVFDFTALAIEVDTDKKIFYSIDKRV